MPEPLPRPAACAAPRHQAVARVVRNDLVCSEHYRLVVRLDSFPPTRAGQFVQIACRDLDSAYNPEGEIEWAAAQSRAAGKELLAPLAFLRRPFSLAGRRDTPDGVELEIIYRVVGVGTAWLTGLKRGDRVHLLGPLGNTFTMPGNDDPAVLVGGGVGIPPMLYLASQLAGSKAVAFCGAVRRELLPLTITDDAPAASAGRIEPLYNVQEFASHGIPAIVTTDDGSYGFHGLVTVALEHYLRGFFVESAARARLTIYTCGPEPMMKRVAEIAMARGIRCQVSVERAMACGMGTCQSCVIRVRRPAGENGREWVYKLACTDGPVFEASDLMW